MVRIGNVEYTQEGEVAVLTCENPPVNQLSYALRVGLDGGFKRALADSSVKAILLRGNKRTFIAGADIKEFSNGMLFKCNLDGVLKLIETSSKPVVAAIHGTALGGGLETAMCCHYRIGSSLCKVGLPEVQLGLLPGAGGTQRLPRLVGPLLAAEFMMTGKHIDASRARTLGVLDRTVKCEKPTEYATLTNAALAFAREMIGKPVGPRVISSMPCESLDPFFLEQLRGMAKKTARGHIAPPAIIRCIEKAGSGCSFEEGMKFERKEFTKLVTSSESAGLQHVFFAQRQTVKVPGVDPKLARPIKSVGIIGCGTMGGGIAINFVKRGIPVVILEVKQEALNRGLRVIHGGWKRKVKRKKMTKTKFKELTGLIKGTTNYNDLANVDLVIEAVFESMEVKKAVFTKLDQVCKPSCILGSNTSTLDIDRIASFTSRPEMVVGTHFFSPANIMMLLENVRGAKTSNQVLATVQKMGKTIRKLPVLVGNCDGFVGNRVYGPYTAAACHMMEEGASPYDIDKVIYKFGMNMGVFKVMDVVGNDVPVKIRKAQGIFDPKTRPRGMGYCFTLPDRLSIEHGRQGQKTGAGFYDYEGRKANPSEFVLKLLDQVRKEKNITPRQIGEKEIIERMMYAMVNEGLKVVDEGIASRPSDVDVVFIFGYGFPATRGGPMHWGDRVGMKKIRDALRKYYAKYPDMPFYKPARLLEELADKKMSLAKYFAKQQKSKM